MPLVSPPSEPEGAGACAPALTRWPVTAARYREGSKEFQPWGHCFEQSLWIHHYQKDPALMRRRYRRAVAGESICGEGFEPGVICHMADRGKPLELKCGSGKTITAVEFASLGYQQTSGKQGPCSEGPSALQVDQRCNYPSSKALVEHACLGKRVCELVNDHNTLGIADPCPGYHWERRFLVSVRCS